MLSTPEALDSFIAAGDTRSRYTRRKIMAMTDLDLPACSPVLNGIAFENCGEINRKLLSQGCKVVIVADSKAATTPADIAEHFAKAIYLMDYLERKAVPVVCVDAAVVTKADPALLAGANIEIAYDQTGRCSITPTIKTEDMKLLNGNKIEWHGPIPRILMNNIVADRDREYNQARTERIRETLSDFAYVPIKRETLATSYTVPGKTDPLRYLAKALSFGNIELPASEKTDLGKKDPNARWLLENVEFKKKLRMERPISEIEFDKQIQQVNDMLTIWSHLLAPYHLTFACNDLEDDIEGIEEFGRWLGADSAVQAYFDGVPLKDILI